MQDIKILQQEIKKLKGENEKLKQIAYLDGLTQCYNRNWYYANITTSSDVYITLADVNFLRTINFVLGHSEGDRLIQQSVDIFKKHGDVVRLGGDEFIIISYDKESYEKLQQERSNKYSLGGCYKPKGMKVSRAVEIADRILYENKRYIKQNGSEVNASYANTND